MSIALAAALAAVSTVQPSCSWDHPGLNPYTGNTRAALDRYTDIPEPVRIALKRRIADGQPDETVEITRDAIRGKGDYYPGIADMHFGAASVCHSVTRAKWDAARVEPGAVYCVKEHCILVPRICGNVSRIFRRGPHPVAVLEAPAAPHGALDDGIPAMDPGMAEPDDGDPGQDAERMKARQRAQAALGAVAAVAGAAALEDDAERNRLAGHYAPPFQFPAEPPADDVVSPSPVPEAQQWTMLLAGLGLLGWAARRRAR